MNNGLNSVGSVVSFTISNQKIYAGTGGGDILVTTNNGAEWKMSADNLVIYSSITSLASNGGYIFACSDGPGIFVSKDDGISWIQSRNGIGAAYAYTLACSVSNVYVGTWNGVFCSTDLGELWFKLPDGMINTTVNILLADRKNIIAGNNGGVYLLHDGEQKWIDVSDSLNSLNIMSLAANNDFVFAGAYDGTVWRRLLSELYTDIKDNDNLLPAEYYLSQNYPNPFNPMTTISYQLPTISMVKLNVYDLLGREVATLVNEEKTPGNYEVKFDGTNLPSGVYFYTMSANGFLQSKKMILMK